MPVDVQYLTDPTGVILVYTGVITGKDIIDVNDKLADCRDCVYQLSDFTTIERLNISIKEMHRIAIQDCSIPPYYALTKMALVGNTSKYDRFIDLYYVFLEIWVGKHRKYQTKTFDDVGDARQWVGI